MTWQNKLNRTGAVVQPKRLAILGRGTAAARQPDLLGQIASSPQGTPQRPLAVLRRVDGSQLLEFALVLPLLLVLAVGIFDFGSAYNLKQKLANAAREGARIAASEPTSDLTTTSCSNPTASCPCSVQAVADAVVHYLNNARVSASCINPGSPTSSGTLTWTYSCGNGTALTINRGYTFTATGGNLVAATQVTLTYPYAWSLNGVISLLNLGSLSLPSTISTNGVMQNLN